MNEKENFVPETGAENVEPTTEESTPAMTAEGDGKETEKTYTLSEVDAMVKEKLDQVLPGKIARTKAKIQKEYDSKYGELLDTLRAGTGKESVEELTDTFKGHYVRNGVKLPAKPTYSARELEILARAEAEDIIEGGEDEVEEELNRLTRLGASGMTERERAVFKTLASHMTTTKRNRELTELGVGEDVYGSAQFEEFAAKFDKSVSAKEIYEIYAKTQPQKAARSMGSMKNTAHGDEGVKDFYSFEEASKFTRKDFDKNPKLYEAVRKSMTKW